MKNPFMHNISVRLVPFLLAWLLRGWFATCRATEHGRAHRAAAVDSEKGVIAIFWHYSLVYLFYHQKDDSAAALVSASEDGDYIASLAHHLNFTTIRGSRNRGGMKALKQMMNCLRRGENLAIVADGSQGPPLIVQSGSVLLASKTGSPILPMTWSASRYMTFNSWDRTAVPKPFSTIDVFYGEPLFVPPGLDSDGIEEYRLKLEEEMVRLYRKAWSHQNRDKH
jgi:lysophospholipid acyltransferase (LPLAT)-like uncharacterized protein